MINIDKLVELGDKAAANTVRGLPIDEATYYGKNKVLLECEERFNKLIQLCSGRSISGVNFTALYSGEFTEELNSIGEKLGKLFGFRNVQINNNLMVFLPQNILVLSSTAGCNLVGSTVIKYAKRIVNGKATIMIDMDKHHKGIKFKPNSIYDLRIFISADMFNPDNSYQLTGAEIMAILLHEIGHSFYVGPLHEIAAETINMLNVVDLANLAQSMIVNGLLVEGSTYATEYLNKEYKTKNIFSRIFNSISSFMSPYMQLTQLFEPIRTAMVMMAQFSIATIMTPLTFVGGLVGYDAEKFSDSFATTYGYGAELASAMIKLEQARIPFVANRKNKAVEVSEFLLGMVKMPIYYLSLLCDPHSVSVTRLENNLKYMKAAGEKLTNDPKLKKEYEESLKKLEDLEKDILAGKQGNSFVDKTHTVTLFAEKLTRITSIKDLVSFLQPKYSNYTNLDRPE